MEELVVAGGILKKDHSLLLLTTRKFIEYNDRALSRILNNIEKLEVGVMYELYYHPAPFIVVKNPHSIKRIPHKKFNINHLMDWGEWELSMLERATNFMGTYGNKTD